MRRMRLDNVVINNRFGIMITTIKSTLPIDILRTNYSKSNYLSSLYAW